MVGRSRPEPGLRSQANSQIAPLFPGIGTVRSEGASGLDFPRHQAVSCVDGEVDFLGETTWKWLRIGLGKLPLLRVLQ
jgi:hypothetical protein